MIIKTICKKHNRDNDYLDYGAKLYHIIWGPVKKKVVTICNCGGNGTKVCDSKNQ